MRIFKNCKFIKECPICKTKKQGDAILVGIDGTQEGRNIQAEVFHLDCIELLYSKEQNILVQKIQ